MKASELRIGNWIYNNKYVQVTSKMIDLFNNELYDLLPIPLTEEWLVKFGLEGHDYTCPEYGTVFKNEEFTLDLDEYSQLVIQTDFSFGISDLRGNDNVAFSNDILDSVHKLQNLYFALTGEELKIK